MVERAGRGWCLSREGVISLVGDSHWEPDDPPGLDLPPAAVNTPVLRAKSSFFFLADVFAQTKRLLRAPAPQK